MKKEHSIFIVLESHEVLNILSPYIKRKGWIKDVPRGIEPIVPFDDAPQINIEYHWEEEIK